ncbi:MAG: DUF3043 domain-containing protein [Jatrophihabitans sp.]|uniref:DUF3043 domain-containing protein n=1 Tax=Jatrophihabitans sp. TaxID=1932789 RepID=UPI003F7DC254
MKLRRTESAVEPEPEPAEVAAPGSKGRPTPKRREAEGRRGPVTAPKTRKEAVARQRELAKLAKTQPKRANSLGPMTAAERREAMRRGDPSVLPRRDQGPTRQLARDYVDSRRMLSNYMLWLFPLMVVGGFVPQLSFLTLVLFLVLLLEWYVVGRRIRALALQWHGKADGGALGIGFYAGSRAYLPRRWRLPAPRVQRGDPI